MKAYQTEEAELRRYLLGDLTLEEQVLVEERLFLDSEYMQLAEALEAELVDEYANQDLTPAERKQFESHFLARPAHRDDLRIAEALKRYIAAETEPAAVVQPVKENLWSSLTSLFGRRAVLGFSFAAALIILSIITWLAVGSWRRQESSPLQAQETPQPPAPGEQKRPESPGVPPDNSRGEVAGGENGGQPSTTPGGRQGDNSAEQGGRPQKVSPPTVPAPTRVVAFVLLPGGGVRGGGQGESVSITADVGTVVLRLPLVDEESYRSYRATLETGGRTIRPFDKLTSELDPELGKVIQVRVPAELLRRQSYQVQLSGITADGRTQSLTSYTFVVERR
jgi:hypothetical protein